MSSALMLEGIINQILSSYPQTDEERQSVDSAIEALASFNQAAIPETGGRGNNGPAEGEEA